MGCKPSKVRDWICFAMTAWHLREEIFKSLDHEGAAEPQVVLRGKMYQGVGLGIKEVPSPAREGDSEREF